VDMLTQWMLEYGYDTAFIDAAGNAVGIIGKGSRDIVLLGHIDTFGGNPPVRREERYLYGRGSVDAKGSLAAFAVGALRANLADDVRLIVIGAVEEEARSSKGARFAATQYQPQMCVIGEPSQWDRITIGYKGRLLLEWEWRGALAHSAGQAATGAELAFAYWQRVQDYTKQTNEGEDRIFGQLDVTLQDINTGQDGAYGWARMTIGFRLPPKKDPYQIASDLQNEENATVTAHGHEVAIVADKNTRLSAAFRGAIRAQGGKPRFVHKTGTSDMNVVAPIWNLPNTCLWSR
ncbi:MAG: M20/M25/M40 family metallo-hydrolase, partial [Anaerolineae bacterium]|nr:M20/M25/M40 family metallo-hydrolase [Anaerolineae bacterium]